MVHYIDDILQVGPFKVEVANAMDIFVNCYKIEEKSNENSVIWTHDVIFNGPEVLDMLGQFF